MRVFSLALCVATMCVAFAGASTTMFMQPRAGATGPAVAVIFIHGAQIPNTNYETLFSTMQNSTDLSLWVGLPGFTFDIPNPIEIASSVKSALTMMYSAGMSQNTPIFYSGHSLGSVIVQDYLVNNSIANAAGQILTGGFLQRKYFWPNFTYPVPTLTIGGELDGLSRVTRIVESYYIQTKRDSNEKAFPTVVLKGVNHFEFCGQGAPPLLVKERDLMAEASQTDAWASISALYVDYIKSILNIPGAGSVIAAALQETDAFSAPIIAAFELEGSRHFNVPAQIDGPLASQCVKGGCPGKSTWAPKAQFIIGADIPGWSLDVSNEYVLLAGSPITGQDFHLPVITQDPVAKEISVTTYVEGNWDSLDDFDTGFSSTSANELGTKLASRQCLLMNGANYTADQAQFNVTDAPQFCQMTNIEAYQWALNIAGTATRERYDKYGQQFIFGDDQQKDGGPAWIFGRLAYDSVKLPDGSVAIQISSPSAKTEIDYWKRHFGPIPRPPFIPDPGCFHYCKLLSPARAVEWMYVDSLRLNRHI